MSPPSDDPLTVALIAALATTPKGQSLPRLCKRLGVRMSVLLRTLAWIGEDAIAGIPGAGLVRVTREGERDIATLTDTGRQWAATLASPPHHAPAA